MNFKTKALLILLSMTQSIINGQTATLEWGTETELKLENVKYMACSDPNTCYVLDFTSNMDFFITRLSSLNPQGEKRKVRSPEINGNPVEIKDLLAVDGELILLASYSDNKAKTRTLYAYHFNTDLSLKDKPGIVGIVKNVGNKDYGQSRYFLSEDRKTLCFYRRTPADSLSVGFTATDKNQNRMWDLDVSASATPYGGNKAQLLLSDGKFAFAVRVDKTKKETVKGQPDYYYKIYTYNPGTKKITEAKFELESKYIQPVKFAEDVNGNILCGGLYSLHREYDRRNANNFINGFFCLVLDKNTGAIIKQEVKSIGNDDVKPTIFDVSFYDYQLDHLLPMSDGTLMFITEQRSEFAAPGGGFYNAGDNLMIAMMNLQTHNFGTLNLSKSQVKNDRDYTYFLFPQKNKVDLIFNVDEQLKEKTSAKGEPVYLSLDSKSVIFYQISIDGKSKIVDNKVNTTNIGPGYILDRSLYTKVNDNTYIVSAKTEKGAYRFGKLVLK
jgi:hypothetical protein